MEVFKNSVVNPSTIVVLPGGDCGGVAQIFYEANISEYPEGLTSLTNIEQDVAEYIDPAQAKINGGDFTVSASEPATVVVDAVSCSGLVDWGVSIDYTYLGDQFKLQVGSATDPIRIIGPTTPTRVLRLAKPDGSANRAVESSDLEPSSDCIGHPRRHSRDCAVDSFPFHSANPKISVDCRGDFAVLSYNSNGVPLLADNNARAIARTASLVELYERDDTGWRQLLLSTDGLLHSNQTKDVNEAQTLFPEWFH